MSANSLQYPSTNQDFFSSELTILKTPASPEITQVSTDEKPSSYSASSKSNSSSRSLQRNSSEFMKIVTNTSEASSPMNPSLATGDSREAVIVAPDKAFLSSQDRHVNRSRQKGSHRNSPSPPDEVALWREDSSGFSVDLVISSNKNAAQTLAFHPIHLKSCGDIHETEGHNDGLEVSPLSEDLIKSCKSNALEQDNILPCHDSSSLSNKGFGESLSFMSQTPQGSKSDFASMPGEIGQLIASMPGDKLSEAEEHTEKLTSEEEPSHCIDVERGRFGNEYDSTEESVEIDLLQNQIDQESQQDANEHYVGYGKSETITLAKTNDSLESELVDVHSISDKELGHDGYGASSHGESNKVEDVNAHSISDNDHLTVEHVYGFGANRSHANRYSSCESDDSSQISIASKSSTSAQEHMINVFQHGHQRSHSDLTPVKSLFKAESLKQEKLNRMQHGSKRYSHEQTDKLRREFARRLESMTASMESLRKRGGLADRVVMQKSMPWMHREEAGEEHEKSSFSDAPYDESSTTSSGTSDVLTSPINDRTISDSIDLLADQHSYPHVETYEHLQKFPASLDALSRKSTALTDCADSNITLQASSFLEPPPALGSKVCLEEILQSKDGQSLMQEALEMKPGEEVNVHKSSLDEGVNSSLDTDSVNHSLNKLEMSELMKEDEKKENVQPLDVHVNSVSRPSCELEEHLKVSDDQFEKLVLEKADVLCNDGELSVVNDIEGSQMGMHDGKMQERTREEDSRHIPALVEFDDCNHMLDHCQTHQESANLQDVEPSCMLQDLEGRVHDVASDATSAGESTPFVHVYVESHVVASTKECGGSKEASMVCEEANSKLDQDTGLEEALQEGEVSKPCWEALAVVDASGSDLLHDKDHICHPSLVQILDAGSTAQSTKPGDTDQLACRPLHDVNDDIQRAAPHFTEPYAGSPSQISDYKLASQTTKSASAAQSTYTESAVQFTGSGTQYALSTQVVDGSGIQPLHEDDQRPAAHFTKPYTGSFTAVNAANEYAHLHGHPTYASTLNHDSIMDMWDKCTNVSRYKRKGSYMRKLARGCLSCCTKPHTYP